MIGFPPCKINVGLRILRKRADGYHDLETLFYPIPLRDALEILPAETVALHITGAGVPGDPSTNLCLRAHSLLATDFASIRPVDIHLHKHIPTGAGLGGGSSDGAYTLLLLNRLFRLGLSREDLLPYAARLGSDCPFFLYEGPCFASGRGEILQPAEVDLSGYQLVLVNPGIHVPTAWAFAQLGLDARAAAPQGLEDAAGAERRGEGVGGADGPLGRAAGATPGGAKVVPPIATWKDVFRNDFEPAVFNAYPEVAKIKDTLYARGAVYASMSGSGSTVYGIFKEEAPLARGDFPAHYWVGRV